MSGQSDRSPCGDFPVGVEADDESADRKILIVEDDPVIVELIQEIVSSLGYRSVVADNARDALDSYAECCSNAACVILDYGVPGMAPSRFLAQLREINSEVKVIVSSGYPQSFIRQDFPIETVSVFIPKPYEPKILVAALSRIVGSC